jgi:hypothetical protein
MTAPNRTVCPHCRRAFPRPWPPGDSPVVCDRCDEPDHSDAQPQLNLEMHPPMTEQLTPDERARLTPADPDELRKALSFALQYNGRKRNHHADGLAADIAADHLARALETGNYVVMRKPTPTGPATWPPAPRNPHLTD